jgi:hypothetical protein
MAYNSVVANERKYREWKKRNQKRRADIESLFGRYLTDNEYMNICHVIDCNDSQPGKCDTVTMLNSNDISFNRNYRHYSSNPFAFTHNFTVVDNISSLQNTPATPGDIIHNLSDGSLYIFHENQFTKIN